MESSINPNAWLQRVSSVAEFVAAPIGKYVARKSFLYFQSAEKVSGFALWGSPTADDVRELMLAMRLHSGQTSAAHASLIDMSELVSIDSETFDTFADELSRRYADLGRAFSKQAVLRPSGFVGATVAGF